MTNNNPFNWVCTVGECGKPANYHRADFDGDHYYCDDHWAEHLGLNRKKKKRGKEES